MILLLAGNVRHLENPPTALGAAPTVGSAVIAETNPRSRP